MKTPFLFQVKPTGSGSVRRGLGKTGAHTLRKLVIEKIPLRRSIVNWLQLEAAELVAELAMAAQFAGAPVQPSSQHRRFLLPPGAARASAVKLQRSGQVTMKP